MDPRPAHQAARAENVLIAALAGIKRFQTLVMVNTSMDFFKNGVGWCVRHKDPKKKETITRRPQAPIFRKLQAAGIKRQAFQAPSGKHPNPSNKLQASSPKLQAPRSLNHGTLILKKF